MRQAAPGEMPHWALPAGVVEDGELVTEALVREVAEETGLSISGSGRLGFVVQVDNRRPEQLHRSRGTGRGYLATIWTFDAPTWSGAVAPEDPEGLVLAAEWVSLAEAVTRLGEVPWLGLLVRYLKGELDPGSLHLQRWHEDGRIEDVGSVDTA